MGRIIKYNKAKTSSSRVESYNSTSGGYPTNNNPIVNEQSANLWGNDFHGYEDIDDSIFCNGDIYINFNEDDFDDSNLDENEEGETEEKPSGSIYVKNKVQASNIYVIKKEEETEEDDGTDYDDLNKTEEYEDIFEENSSGNLYVENKLKVDNDIETPEIYSKTIYLDYPELKEDDSNKTNLLDILKDHKKLTFKDSKNNELGTFDNTADKTITIKNYDDEINSLSSRVSTNETNISNNKTEITNIWEQLNSTDTSSPVILFSGSIHSNNNDSSLTYQPWNVRPNMYSQHIGVNNIEMDYYKVNGEKKPMLVVKVNAKDGWTIKPTSVNSSVTLNSHWNPTVDFGGNRRSQGFWTTGGVYIDGNIYLNVWRTHDDNNDSTVNDCIAWSAQEMNLTIFGTAFKNS